MISRRLVSPWILVAVAGLAPALAQDTLFVEGDRVSIGKSNPQAPLEIDGSGSTLGVGNSIILLKNPGPLTFQLEDTSFAGSWNFSVVSNEFRISRSGTGSTELILTPAGDLTIKGDITTASCAPCVSDYVFEPGYDLMPLADVGSYIEENGHLPNVPSEAEYRERGGAALHEMQVKLLEKIEELTLYTLEQQETIEELRARLEAVEITASRP